MQTIRVALVAGALLVPAFAQTADPNASPRTTSPGTSTTTPDTVEHRDRDFNMGWLGLVGLAGLLGLRRHSHHNEARTIDSTGPSGLR